MTVSAVAATPLEVRWPMAAEQRGGSADVLVIFGITGDLARKMTFRALYRLERRRMLGNRHVHGHDDGRHDG